MKKIMFITLCIIGFFHSHAQDAHRNIEKDFNAYCTLFSERKTDEAMTYINPILYEVVSKEVVKQSMENIFDTPGMELKFGKAQITGYDSVTMVNGEHYIRFYGISPIAMKFEDYAGDTETIAQMLQIFQNLYGKKNVAYDSTTGFFEVNTEKVYVASSKNGLSDWKFIIVDHESVKELLKGLLPEDFLEDKKTILPTNTPME